MRFLLMLAVVTSGCRSNAPVTDGSVDLTTASDLAGDTRPSGDRAPEAAARPPQCLEQDAKLGSALAAARKSPNALLVVRNAACGTSVYLSGDSASATAASLWRIGSVTKTYVAASLLSQVRAGRVGLDDLLSTWVTGVSGTDGVTVRMLLNHTSGIFNYTDDPALGVDPKKAWKPDELVALATKHAPYFAPGAGWHYSNTNYVLLGVILERLEATKASAALRLRALSPAGLTHTFLDGEEALQGQLATGFNPKGDDVTQLFNPSVAWTAGAMVASGADLCDWVATLFGDTKVLDEVAKKTMTDGAVATSAVSRYGLGVELLDGSITAGAGPAMGHGGSISGFGTQAYWFPEKKTAICSVVNQDGISANDLTLAALLALF